MLILRTYEAALKFALEHAGSGSGPSGGGPWSQSRAAIENTLRLVFRELGHSCYLLVGCGDSGREPFMVKLEPNSLPAEFQRKTRRVAGRGKTRLRVMQCIVKPVRAESSTSWEYPALLAKMTEAGMRVPAGLWVLNISDAVLVRRDGRHPWPQTGLRQLRFGPYDVLLPILSGSGHDAYWDIPIPNYDDVRLTLGVDAMPTVPGLRWDHRKPGAVFRGGPTGCGTTERTNMRLKVTAMTEQLGDLDTLNAGVVSTRSGNARFDPVLGLSRLNSAELPKPLAVMSMEDQARGYKYALQIDGNVAAYRLTKLLGLGFVVLLVESPYHVWYQKGLRAWEHYVPIAADLSDLLQKIQWCRAHDAECKAMAVRGKALAKRLSSFKVVAGALLWATTAS